MKMLNIKHFYAYLAYKYFKEGQDQLTHCNFKMSLAERLVNYKDIAEPKIRRSMSLTESGQVVNSHIPLKLAHPKPYFYCRKKFTQNNNISMLILQGPFT